MDVETVFVAMIFGETYDYENDKKKEPKEIIENIKVFRVKEKADKWIDSRLKTGDCKEGQIWERSLI